MTKFALKRGYSDKEAKTLHLAAAKNPEEYKVEYFQKASDVDYTKLVPAGDIDWVQACYDYKFAPGYYPDFLSHMLYRKIWKEDKWPMKPGIFIKPYDKPKRYSSRITTGTYKGKKKGPHWCSELIKFKNEWRYYIVWGEVVYAGWYDGIDDDEDPPYLDVNIPESFCGVIDMGLTTDNKFALVEAGEPYSVGWYGTFTEGEIYAYFLSEGAKYLRNIKGSMV